MGFCFSKNVQRTTDGCAPVFTCSGVEGTDYNFYSEKIDGFVNWQIEVLNNTEFVFDLDPGEIDLFLVGGGGAGDGGQNEGAGGGGGYAVTSVKRLHKKIIYQIKIGAGAVYGSSTRARGETTSFLSEDGTIRLEAEGGFSAEGGNGGNGGSGGGGKGFNPDVYTESCYAGNGGSYGGNGSGGHASTVFNPNDDDHEIVDSLGGTGQGNNQTRAFGEPNGTPYAGGGAGGGSNGLNNIVKGNPGVGGGGAAGIAGVKNTGGGGGCHASGGSGIVIIRNHRSTTVETTNAA